MGRLKTTTTTRLASALPLTLLTLSLALLFALLGGCASRPSAGGSSRPASASDGPEANPPPDLLQVPDAEPRLEPIRAGGANKPYVVSGQRYEPLTQDQQYREQGLASWYGRLYNGKPTASGEPYDMYAMSAAHPTLPIPSYARIRNPANGREVVVRINDRGPFRSGRIVDLSYTAALKLDVLRGTAPVELERITADDIRTGAWRRDRAAPLPLPLAVPTTPASAPPATAEIAAPAPAEIVAPLEDPRAATANAAAFPGEPSSPATARLPVPGYWLQLGAFRQQDGALLFQKQVTAQVAWLGPLLTVFEDAPLFKLQAGPFPSRDDARAAAARLRAALQLTPVMVERR